jgi:hypothetical protein
MKEAVAVLCVRTVEDDLGVYTQAGKRYEVLEDISPDLLIVETEPVDGVEEMQISRYDEDFSIIYAELED